VRLKGLREKGPLRLAVEGALAGGFLVAIATRGDISAAWQAGIGIGIICGLIGLAGRQESAQLVGRSGRLEGVVSNLGRARVAPTRECR